MDTSLTIGRVAHLAGVGVETIRFYERKGLIPPPPRRPSGYRQYPVDTVRRILFIRRAKDLGFTLKEIEELLGLRVGGRAKCSTVRSRAERKIESIDDKLRVLEKMRQTLLELTRACDAGDPTDECCILEALDADG